MPRFLFSKWKKKCIRRVSISHRLIRSMRPCSYRRIDWDSRAAPLKSHFYLNLSNKLVLLYFESFSTFFSRGDISKWEAFDTWTIKTSVTHTLDFVRLCVRCKKRITLFTFYQREARQSLIWFWEMKLTLNKSVLSWVPFLLMCKKVSYARS